MASTKGLLAFIHEAAGAGFYSPSVARQLQSAVRALDQKDERQASSASWEQYRSRHARVERDHEQWSGRLDEYRPPTMDEELNRFPIYLSGGVRSSLNLPFLSSRQIDELEKQIEIVLQILRLQARSAEAKEDTDARGTTTKLLGLESRTASLYGPEAPERSTSYETVAIPDHEAKEDTDA